MTGAIPLVSVVTQADAEKWNHYPFVSAGLGWVQQNAWWLLVTMGLFLFLAKVVKKLVGPPWLWNTVSNILEDARLHMLRHTAADESHHNRVTLFKHVRCRFRMSPWRLQRWPWGKRQGASPKWNHPWSGWLVPVMRTGHTSQRSKFVFLAPDDADDAEGVVGRTWCGNGVEVKQLPEITLQSDVSALEEYARRSSVGVDLIRKRLASGKTMSRSFLGFPIEVKGKQWGVLVFDSRRSDGIKSVSNPTVALTAKMLGELLARA